MQRTTKMTFSMLDYLRTLNEVFMGGVFLLFISAFFLGFRFIMRPVPVIAHRFP